MGRFFASVLLLVGACGDNVGDGLGSQLPDDGAEPGGYGTVVARYQPQVCGVHSWDPKIGLDPAQDVSVAVRADNRGSTVFATPLAGGTITGFVLDERGNMEGDTASKLPINNAPFTKGTVSYVQNRPVSTAIADGAAYVHMLDDTLSTAEYITKLPATALSEPTFLYAQGNLVMPVGSSDGMWMHRFHDSLEPIDSKHFKTTKPVLAITSAQLGTAMMTAFTTETECHLMVNTTYEPGVTTRVNAPCPSPRLSVNEATGDAVLLFESPDGIRLMPIYITMFGGDAPVIRADATAPRTVFDGKRFWISYIDSRGDVIAGFLDDKNRPVTMSLGAPQPERAGYELVMLDGSPTIFSLDSTGYTAYRLCAENVNGG